MPATARSSGGRRFGVLLLAPLCGGILLESPRPSIAEKTSLVDVAPLGAGDVDRDGLLDQEENALATRFAPLVVLDARDANRPASLDWLLRTLTPTSASRGHASRDDVSASALPSLFDMPATVRGGASDPRDWSTYVHVFPSEDGGVHVQYWFFYPYNDGPWLFDHDADWEHVTVRLDAAREPVGVDLAQHEHDCPGRFRKWSTMKRVGEHPVVLSALGSHASYAAAEDAPWFDRTSQCVDLESCTDPQWRTWNTPLVNVGERANILVHHEPLAYRGRWGKKGHIPGTSAPFGAVQHRGFCAGALARCSERAPFEAERVADRTP